MEDHTGYFEARADNIINKGLLDETSVAFYRALFELQGREYGRFASLPSLPPVGAEDLPLSRHAGIVLTDDLLASVAGGAGPLGAVMAEHHPGPWCSSRSWDRWPATGQHSASWARSFSRWTTKGWRPFRSGIKPA